MTRILLWGNGEIARTARAYFKSFPYKPIMIKNSDGTKTLHSGFPQIENIVNKDYAKEDNLIFEDYEYKTGDRFFPSVSYTKCNSLREEVFDKMLAKGVEIVSHKHPKASIFPDTEIGAGCWIQEHCNIQSGAKLGNGVVCWASSHCGHSAILEDFVWLTTGSVICSNVRIGKGSFIGANAVISPGVEVGHHCIIGSGAIITRNAPAESVAVEGRNNIINKKSWEIKL